MNKYEENMKEVWKNMKEVWKNMKETCKKYEGIWGKEPFNAKRGESRQESCGT